VSGARRATLAGLGLALAVATAPPARAQSGILEEAPSEAPAGKRYRSPQRFAFELKFGPYRPDVDSEFASSGPNARAPYKDFFGNGRCFVT